MASLLLAEERPRKVPLHVSSSDRETDGFSLAGKCAVIVEDEGVTQLQLSKMLRSQGIEVVGTAGDGKEAVEVVLQERPDFVLMDIRMPVMDGLEASERILAEYRVCIVMLTAFSEEEYKKRTEALGACGTGADPYSSRLVSRLSLKAGERPLVQGLVSSGQLNLIQGSGGKQMEELIPILAAFQRIGVNDLTLLERYSGYEADIFRIHAGEAEFALRLFPGTEADDKTQTEARVIRFLNAVNFPAPKLYDWKLSGESPWGRPYLIIDWVDGTSLAPTFWGADTAQRRETRSKVLKLMSQLHSVTIPDDARILLRSARETLKAGILVTESEAYRQAYLKVERALQAASPLPDVLLHGDFHAGNLLETSEGTVVVIDWSDAWYDDPRFDVAWVFTLTRARDEPDGCAFNLKDYAGAPLSEQDLEPFEAFSALKILTEIYLVSRGIDVGLRPEAQQRRETDAAFLSYLRNRLLHVTGVAVPESGR